MIPSFILITMIILMLTFNIRIVIRMCLIRRSIRVRLLIVVVVGMMPPNASPMVLGGPLFGGLCLGIRLLCSCPAHA